MIGAHSVSRDRKCSSHHSRSSIFQCVLEMGFSQPHVQTQQWQKSHFLWFGSFWSWRRALPIPCCYSWWNLGPSCWTRDKRQSIGWHHPHSHWKEKSKNSPLVNKVMTTVFWECEPVIFVDAVPRGETLISDANIRTLTEVRNHFKKVQHHNINLPSGWQCKTTHMFEDLESCHKIWLVKYHFHPNPDLAPSNFCLFGVWGMEFVVRSTTYNKVIWTVRTWGGKGLVLTRHTSTCSLLAQGLRSGQRLCGKIGCEVKSSLFTS